MPKIDDLDEAVPALQDCLQSREGAVTKVGIWRACTGGVELKTGNRELLISEARLFCAVDDGPGFFVLCRYTGKEVVG